MSLEDEVSALRRNPLFAKISPTKLKLLAFTSERIDYSEGQNLFRMGDQSDSAYVIIKGSADVLVDTPDGEITVAKIEKNAFVGEIGILCDVPRTATIRATRDLETLKISKEQFLQLLAEFPDAAIEVMRVLAERLTSTTSELTQARKQLREL
ncbi:MAG: cyclic nucleotide-binding domain-containing protein, partial [Rhodobacteraceae bacterium]|nr:cyclic nucleotide-binding domain-containing protein [Paracoccaceae bacterium]